MATIIRIKRSTGQSAPGVLRTGELAYSAGAGLYNNGGDRLYFGKGDDGNGIATTVEVIGGAYFANLLDHQPGALTASSAIVTDADNKIDQLIVDNIDINLNTISTTTGNLVLAPDGNVSVSNNKITDLATPTLAADAATKAYVDEVSGASTIDIVGDTGSDTVNIKDSDLLIAGGQSITTTITDNTITIDAVVAGYNTIGVAEFDSDNFFVSLGAVSTRQIVLGSTSVNNGETTPRIIGLDSFNVGEIAMHGAYITTNTGALDIDAVTSIISPVTKALGDSDINVFNVEGADAEQLFEVRQTGDVIIGGVLTVQGNGTSTFNGDVDIGGALQVQNGATITASLQSDNMTITGNLTVNGNTVLGDSEANDTISFGGRVASDILFDADNTYNIGEVDNVAANVYTTNVVATTVEATNATIGSIEINDNTITNGSGSAVMYIDPAPEDSDGGELVIRGNLTIQGTTTTVNSTTVSINDKNLVLADSAASAAEADGAGITINGPTTPATITYNGATDAWEFNKAVNLTDSDSLQFNGVDWKEVIEDHLVDNLLQAGEGIDLTYDDNANTLTVSAELATLTNPGVASFGGWADSDETVRQFSVTSGDVTIVELDGGTF